MDGMVLSSIPQINIIKNAFPPLLILSFLCNFIFSVFNVIDGDGNKIRDQEVINYITKVSCFPSVFHSFFSSRNPSDFY